MITDTGLKADIASLVAKQGARGATVAELRVATGRHHGHVSGALSFLHAADDIARLGEKRGGCKVYVDPTFIGGRLTEAQGRR